MNGALAVTLAMLLRLINCRFIIIIINLLTHLLISEPTKPPFDGDELAQNFCLLVPLNHHALCTAPL